MRDIHEQAQRWQVAIHEAGHLVVSLLLADDLTKRGVAIVESHDGAGCATIPTNISDESYTIAVAAGAIAAEMFASEPVPPMPPNRPDPRAPLPIFPREPSPNPTVAPPQIQPDEVRIAQWCIHHRESQPWAWVRNYMYVTGEARHLVRENRTAILAVARKVFQLGFWGGCRTDLVILTNEPNPPAAPSVAANGD